MIRREWLAGFLAAMSMALSLHGQQHPTHARGFDATKIYQVDGLDSVSLFNGNVGLRIPIGSAYPVSESFSYGLTLTYNSKVWDHVERWDGGEQYIEAVPSRRSNAGFGWLLSAGRLFPPYHPTNESANQWIYEDPSGAETVLFPGPLFVGDSSSSYSGVRYSRNSSYLRMREVSSSVIEIDFPDGTIHRFGAAPDGSWRVTQLRSAFGSTVTVGYAADEMSWWMTDPHGRTQTVWLTIWGNPQANYAKLVDRVVLTAFDQTTAQYTFTYADKTFTRGCANTWPYGSLQVTVPTLTGITLPDGSYYSASYIADPVAGDCRQGGIDRLQLPTLGAIEWTYQTYRYPSESCYDGTSPWYGNVPGVATRRFLDAANVEQARWTYQWQLSPPVSVGWCDAGFERTVEEHVAISVTSPTLDRDVYYFSVWPDLLQSPNGARQDEYGLPFTRRSADSSGSRFLSSQSFECDAAGICPSNPHRSRFVRYERDAQECFGMGYGCLDAHRRPVSGRTVFHDDGNRLADDDSSNFDGFGHYRQTDLSGNFSAADARTAFTNFNPGTDSKGKSGGVFRFPPATPWVLNTYDEMSTTQNGVTHRRQFCFEPATGFLQRQRSQKESSRGPNDVLLLFSRDASGNLAAEEWYGGDGQGIGTGAGLCSLALPQTAGGLPNYQYRVEYSHQYGVRRTAQYRAANTSAPGALVSHKDLDLDIDQKTGLVRTSRDTAGVATVYAYDASGRLLAVRPAGRAWTEYVYLPTSAPPSIAMRTCPNGVVSCTASLLESWLYFDGLGRLTQQSQKLGASRWAVSWLTYDPLGRNRTRSIPVERSSGSPAAMPPGTAVTTWDYDSQGRMLKETLPDNSATDYSYTGARLRTRTSRIWTGVDSAVTVSEEQDRHGRLIAVTEPSGPTSASNPSGALIRTEYGYDPANRLSSVVMNLSVSGPVQRRIFDYDGRGFLRWESQPESGISSYRYDARGQMTSKTQGAATSQFDLENVYDAAGRLVLVKGRNPLYDPGDPNQPAFRVLKELQFGEGNSGVDLRNGKLVRATRYNYDEEEYSVYKVTDVYEYKDQAGRRTHKTTGIRLVDGDEVVKDGITMSMTYDDLDLPQTVRYPMCVGCGTPPSDPDRSGIIRTYDHGRMKSISGFIDNVTYWPNGMRELLLHSNAIVDTQIVGIMPRPASISFGQYDECARPAFAVQPESKQSPSSGSSVTLSVSVTGTGPFDYAWWNVTDGEAAGTSASIIVTPTKTTEYYVTVSGQCGIERSQTARITINECQPPETGIIQAVLQPDGSWILKPQPVARPQGRTFSWKRLSDNVIVGTSETLAVGALSVTTTYQLTVTDVCGSGTGTVTIRVPLVMTTTGLQATATTTSQITVQWPPVSGATSYVIERRSGPAWSVLNTSTSSSYIDNAVVQGRTYAYRVYALADFNESNYSNVDVATTASFIAALEGQIITTAPLNDMLNAVNKVREAAGWPPVTWNNILSPTDPVPAPGVAISGRQITSCRARMNEALQALGAPVHEYTDPDLVLRVIKAVHIREVQERAR